MIKILGGWSHPLKFTQLLESKINKFDIKFLDLILIKHEQKNVIFEVIENLLSQYGVGK